MDSKSRGEIIISVGKNETCMFAWMGVDRKILLDCVSALKDYVQGQEPLPFWRESRNGEQIVITDFLGRSGVKVKEALGRSSP
jgi:hypothetical protein